MSEERSEQEIVRREKLAELRAAGPVYPNGVKVEHSAVIVRDAASKLAADAPVENRQIFSVAGRMMTVRHMGKAAFCHLQDSTGRVQVYVKKDDIGADNFERFKALDIGDLITFTGYPFVTKTGEPSLHATSFQLLVKCLHPLPEKWHGLTDVEVRYRQRYLDLIVNEEVSKTFVARAKIISAIRNFFDNRGYVEVETPVMSTIASGASARPFVTHHNTLDLELHLRIALELPLKKLVVGGLERVYELSRVFRNEGISTEHNPEFTMIEFYQAYATYEDLMELTEELIVSLCDKVLGKRELEFKEQKISFERPWKRSTMAEAIHEIGGVDRRHDLNTLAGVQSAAKSLGFEDIAQISDYGLALYEVFDRHVESKIVHPTFITQHPTSISPLARKNSKDERFTDRFELMVAGMELANAFSELNDPADQLERFQEQLRSKSAGNEEAMAMDEDFVRALEYGLPPTAGEGIGIDRLVMLLTNSASIRDVILFPTMRPLSN